jgi:hypothetical protein
MPQYGRYWNGDPYVYNPPTGPGVKVSSISPASDVVSGRVRHGAMMDLALGAPEFGPGGQGFDSAPISSGDIGYVSSRNVDPGATGQPIILTAGEEGSISKAVSLETPTSTVNSQPKLRFMGVLTVVRQLPPPRAFRPAPCAPSKISRYAFDDMNLSMLQALPVPPGFTTSAAWLFERVRWKQQVEITNRPPGEGYIATIGEAAYGSDSAQQKARAALGLSLDIDPSIKENIAAAFCQIGIDVFERVKAGGKYNVPGGLGGILAGFKLPVVLAAIFLDDAEMKEWADRALRNVFAEDRQCLYVTQAHIDTYDYIQDDLGMPEWMQNPVASKTSITRKISGAAAQGGTIKTYRAKFCRHMLGQTMACRLIPGARELWNNQAFFDLADRYHHGNTFYKDTASPLDWGRDVGTEGDVDNSPTDFLAIHDAYRARPECGTRWTWS